MLRFIIPIVLIGLSVGVFLVFTRPIYNEVTLLREKVSSYNEALDNSKALEQERDKLIGKYNEIKKDDLVKLQKLLPENIDNIRLILEIEKISLRYGMMLQDVKYNPTPKKTSGTDVVPEAVPQGAGDVEVSNKDYGIWDLEFSTTGSYTNFLSFIRDLEKNLRIVDIATISFSSNPDSKLSASPNSAGDSYRYSFKIKTYWLKN